ncbi:MAG: dynamin family protein [Bacteroidales bacterium]|nr:dynamin family protein [Bacteroidales bacterium]
MEEQTKELEKKIDTVKTEIEKIFDDDVISSFEPKLKSDLKEINYNCARPLLEQLDNCSRLLKSPVYVGMLGRYSHGKSALVNSLFLLDEDKKLPEGESVVTSKVIRVAFDDSISSPTAYKYFNGEHDCEQFAEYADFQKTAQSKNEDNSGVAFLEAKIPVGDKRTLAKNFFQNNIQLIDMPGLGGPYFDDSAMAREYVEKVDLVVVAIKITEIEESAAVVNKFLLKVSSPKIVVLTFYDLAEGHNTYASCKGDMTKIIEKAKSEVAKHFPNIGDTDDIIVVSNKDNALVDKVRERILQKITVQKIAIQKSNQETPIVKKRKAAELKKELDVLKQKSLELPKRLENLVMYSIGKDEDNKIDICSIFNTSKIRNKKKKRNSDIEKEIKSFKREQGLDINSIKSIDECDSVCDRIAKDCSVLRNNVSEIFNDYNTELREVAEEYILNLNVSGNQKKEFKQSLKEVLNNSNDLLEQISFDSQSVKTAAKIQKAKNRFVNFWNSIFGKTKNEKIKAKEAMENALNKALIKFENDIFKKIEDADIAIQKGFKEYINMSSINDDIKSLKHKKDELSKKIDELLEVIETVKYKI